MLDNGNTPHILDFGEPEKENSIIKVIGVGGGGGNAVNHMYREGIHDVSFVLCNTDNQALNDSPVPVHLQLGKEGLGAGNKPAKARQAAEETLEDIKNMLNDGTKMAFITAGMGGGTGTGAAPVIARVSKELGILTVGIVTIPFRFEGPKKIDQALDGVEEMSKHVDALLVINNERLRQIYPDLAVLDAFGKADDTLSVAAKSIAEIITVHGLINLDFNDVKTVLKDGGVAIMSTGYGEGEGRVKKAIEDALNSPLLNDNDVFNSKKILLSIAFASEKKDNPGLTMDEMNDVNDFMVSLKKRRNVLKEKTAASAIMAAMAIQPSTSVTRTFSCSARKILTTRMSSYRLKTRLPISVPDRLWKRSAILLLATQSQKKTITMMLLLYRASSVLPKQRIQARFISGLRQVSEETRND